MQSFGDDCYVIAVKPKSDAEAKGLKPGDKVLKVDGVAPNRANLWIYQYLYTALAPRPVVNMEVQTAGEPPRQLEVKAKVQTGRQVRDLTETIDFNAYLREQADEAHLTDHIFYEVGKDTIIWRMPTFDMENDAVDERIDKVKKFKTLIIDLRRNAGGAVETLQRLVGNLFDHDVTIGDMKLRKESKPMLAKTRGDSGFKGQVIVLVDSGSNSASEVFARVMQLEKRGTVIGDRTGGKVMRSRLYSHQIGLDTVVYYGVSVTDADLIMADGKTLEGTGVTPDELVLPTPDELRAQKDSVLARAVAIAGGTLDPVEAGKLFPFKWKP
jgi:C-terminal processing protease CtpA/Prc